MSQATSEPRPSRPLPFDALIDLARQRFQKIPDPRRSPTFTLADTLMAGLALFSLKDPSLLAFQQRVRDRNLGSVFGLKTIPSDSQMRDILDPVDPLQLRPLFEDIFRQLQRAKVLEDYAFLEGRYLVALDGVEYFSSQKVHCDHCMTRHHKNGEVSYYHQMLGAVIVHPDFPEVIPLAPEPIQRQDGHNKNDCERNAARRWLEAFRKDHPHLRITVVEDALSSNAPHIRDLRAVGTHFILGVKEADHKHLFEQFYEQLEAGKVEELEEVDTRTKVACSYLFINGLTLNQDNRDVKINFLQYTEMDEAGKPIRKWTWVVEVKLTKANVRRVMRGGRARWRIENETFNTLKNQGYHFEHNYGHGYKNLCVVLALLMMAAFLIDQVQQRCNKLFEKARVKVGSKSALWEAIRHLFYCFEVGSMREIYEAIALGYEKPELRGLIEQAQGERPTPNTS